MRDKDAGTTLLWSVPASHPNIDMGMMEIIPPAIGVKLVKAKDRPDPVVPELVEALKETWDATIPEGVGCAADACYICGGSFMFLIMETCFVI